MRKQPGGAKLVFYDIHAEGTHIQVLSDVRQVNNISFAVYQPPLFDRAYESESAFQQIHDLLRRGDLVGIVGFPGKK